MDATKTYLTEVFWSEEDGGFIAVAPDLPGTPPLIGHGRRHPAQQVGIDRMIWGGDVAGWG